jgi:sirohydrochlorin ferrochelatase
MKTGLVLIAHGSRHAEANSDLHQLVQRLRERAEYACIEPAFLELASPTIAEAAESCTRQGAGRVILLPYFLSAGLHVRRDLTAIRDELASRFPQVEFRLGQPLGQHPLLLEIVTQRAREAAEQQLQSGN